MSDDPSRKSTLASLSSPGSNLGAGLQFAFTIAVFTVVGVWLDRKLETLPWLTLVGVALGGVGATVSLVKRVGAQTQRDRERSRR